VNLTSSQWTGHTEPPPVFCPLPPRHCWGHLVWPKQIAFPFTTTDLSIHLHWHLIFREFFPPQFSPTLVDSYKGIDLLYRWFVGLCLPNSQKLFLQTLLLTLLIPRPVGDGLERAGMSCQRRNCLEGEFHSLFLAAARLRPLGLAAARRMRYRRHFSIA